MESLRFLSVGKSLAYVVLIEDVSFEDVGREEYDGDSGHSGD